MNGIQRDLEIQPAKRITGLPRLAGVSGTRSRAPSMRAAAKDSDQAAYRLLLVEGGSLLDDAVEGLILSETDVQFSRIAYQDENTFRQAVAHAQPDVIILTDDGPLDEAQVCDLLSDQAALRIMVVRSSDNKICLFEKQTFADSHKKDLIALIRNNMGLG